MIRRIAPLLFGLIAAACAGEPADPCTTAHPCAVPPAELAVVAVDVQAASTDAATQMSVVDPRAIDVHFAVKNNGGRESDAKAVQVVLPGVADFVVALPGIASGATYQQTVRVPSPPEGTLLLESDVTAATVAIVGLDDNASNDRATSQKFHLALPTLRLSTRLAAGMLNADAPLPATVSVTNVSRFAALEGASISYCIFDLGGTCTPRFHATRFGDTPVPPLAPGESADISHPVAVPGEATSHNVVDLYSLGTCIARTGRIGACPVIQQVDVRPDYENCNPTVLVPDQVATGELICRLPCDIIAYRMDVRAGNTYWIENAEGGEDVTLRWRTRYRDNPVDASSADGFQPAADQTVYLVTAAKYCGDADLRHPVVLREERSTVDHHPSVVGR